MTITGTDLLDRTPSTLEEISKRAKSSCKYLQARWGKGLGQGELWYSFKFKASLCSVNDTLSEASSVEHPLALCRFGLLQPLSADLTVRTRDKTMVFLGKESCVKIWAVTSLTELSSGITEGKWRKPNWDQLGRPWHPMGMAELCEKI